VTLVSPLQELVCINPRALTVVNPEHVGLPVDQIFGYAVSPAFPGLQMISSWQDQSLERCYRDEAF
jgi:hypothetical protein